MPDIYTCSPGFNTGSGLALQGGFLMEIPFGKVLFMGTRASYMYLHTGTEVYENFPYQFGDNILQGRILHYNEINLHGINGEIYFGLRPFRGFIVSVGVLGNYMLNPSFSQWEELKKPADFGAFDSKGNRRRNEYYNYKINGVNNPALFAKGGISYEIMLNGEGTVRLAPEISYLFPVNSLIKVFDWKLSALGGGVALKFSSKPENPLLVDISTQDEIKAGDFNSCDTIFHSVFPNDITLRNSVIAPAGVQHWEFKVIQDNKLLYSERDTTEVPAMFTIPREKIYTENSNNSSIKYSLEVVDTEGKKGKKEGRININKNMVKLFSEIRPYGIDEHGKKISDNNIRIERKILTEVHPLLNYIFFDSNSDTISSRYNKIKSYEISSFGTGNYKNKDVIGIYRQILNVIGKRLSDNGNAELYLKGYISNNPTETGNPDLANRRAATIKNYLTKIWGIEESRIIIELNQSAGGMPPKPSYPGVENHFKESDEENQRVELYTPAEYSYILDPVIITDTVSNIAPTKFVFKPEIEHSGQNYKWNLDIGLNKALLQEITVNKGDRDSVLVDLKSRKSELIKNDGELNYYYYLTDEYGLKCYKEGKISLDITEADSSINKYSLILFDYESYSMNERNNQVVDMIRKSFYDNSSLIITGYTDLLGDSLSNLELSKNRALQTAKGILEDNSLQPDSRYPIKNNNTFLVVDKKYYQQIPFNKKITGVEVIVRGVGESEPLIYDNSTPEGRFYSRTVTISVINQHKSEENK